MRERSAARVMQPDEVEAVADLHREVFPHYVSSRLGRRFCRHLIARYAERTDAVVLVVDGPPGTSAPVGYLVGCPPGAQHEVTRSVARHAGPGYVGMVLHHPVEALQQLRAAVGRRRRQGQAGRRGGPPDARAEPPPADERVVLIGVAAGARGSGLADSLLDAFASWARAQGACHADLAVNADNAPARGAYERNGWMADPVEDAAGGPAGMHYRLHLKEDQ